MMFLSKSTRHASILAFAVTMAFLASANAATILSTTQEGRVRDSGGINAASDNTGEGRSIRAGTNAGDTIFRGFLVFDITTFSQTVSDANLSIELATNSAASTFSLLGVDASSANGVDTSNGTLTGNGSDFYSAPNTTLSSGNDPALGDLDFDVTSWVEGRRADGDDYVAFRIDESAPVTNGTTEFFTFHDSNDPGASAPQLEVTTIPEPSSLVLLGLGSLGLVVRRRRG